jgi:hypothetical protein
LAPTDRASRPTQHDIAILAALGLLDANDLPRAVNMLDLKPDYLARAQSAAIAETEQNAALETAGDSQQALGLVRAHHQRDLLRLAEVIRSRRPNPVAAASRAPRWPSATLDRRCAQRPMTWLDRDEEMIATGSNKEIG